MMERKRERRKVFWAILASLCIHLMVALSLAAFGGAFASPLPADDKPIELTIIDTATPTPVPKNAAFMETDESRKSAEKPVEKTFESNANSIAASEQPATGDAPVPSQQGKDRPHLDLDTQQSSLDNEGAKPQPTPEEKPPAEPKQSATPPPDALAMLTKSPTPAASPKAEESASPNSPTPTPTVAQIASRYRPMKEQNASLGNITNRGRSAVNAVGTPLGQYQKGIYDAIGSRWYFYTSPKQQGDLINIGTVHIHFWVDRAGNVKNLKVDQNTSNEAFANVCLRSILEIKMPPIPSDVAESLPPEGLYQEISFTIYGN